jgi:uncharacterized protein (TIGR03032 family)
MVPSPDPASPLRSVHTNSLPQLLAELRISLAVSLYHAKKVVVIRADGGLANTHFRDFETPMGLAADGSRLAVATETGIWEFHDQPAVSDKLDPPNRHDAVYMPRSFHVSGHIGVHEIGYAGAELWAVNTRFSCLCTFDRAHSFVPRWRPPFVTGYSADDRCHLNGFCVVGGEPRYVTALGATDSFEGWRSNKASGGVIAEVPSGRTVAGGLCMPHSPRVYDGALWVLESGRGTIARVDPSAGRVHPVAELPGFTRGLDFAGPFAFVGLSQVRASNLFGGLPITQRLSEDERRCGVWVVDLRTGQIVAFLQFTEGVQEVFAVQVLPGLRWPELITDPTNEIVAKSYVLPDAALADVGPSPG